MAPSNITVKAVMATEMDVFWEPVEQSDMNGDLLGYEVSGGKDWDWSKRLISYATPFKRRLGFLWLKLFKQASRPASKQTGFKQNALRLLPHY